MPFRLWLFVTRRSTWSGHQRSQPRQPVSISTWRGYPTGISITSSGLSLRRMVNAPLTRSGLTMRQRSKRSGSSCSIILRILGDFTIFHYGSLREGLHQEDASEVPFARPRSLDSALFNVLGAIRTNVYFPVYSNGLKDIASFLGVNWTGTVTSGIDCIAARMRWEESKECGDQGRDRRLQPARLLGAPAGRQLPPVAWIVRTLPPIPRFNRLRRFKSNRMEGSGKFEFAIPEMNVINKCARFDYQRDKVLLRTDPAVRDSIRRTQSRARPIRRANLEIQCEPPSHCPLLRTQRIRPLQSNQSISK